MNSVTQRVILLEAGTGYTEYSDSLGHLNDTVLVLKDRTCAKRSVHITPPAGARTTNKRQDGFTIKMLKQDQDS